MLYRAAFGSSEFGITVVRMKNGKLEVIYSEGFQRPLYNEMIALIRQLIQKYHVCKVFLDGSNPSIVTELKHSYGSSEYQNYHLLEEKIIRGWETSDCRYNRIVPINFQTHHKEMLYNLMKIVQKRAIRIDNDRFQKLIIALRTAKNKGEYDLDKQSTSYDDLLDALMLSTLVISFK